MTKPAPIVLVAICVIAACTVAFTIVDHFEKKKKRVVAATAKNDSTLFVRKNPPHGQPGHRHDLPDGAPLPAESVNSSIGTSTNNTASLQNVLNSPDSLQSRSVAVNPPHDQAGHICSIPVGAPLSSAPANAATTAAAPSVTTKTGMNPPHGEPGHRCDIAVGAPLNSAPAKTTTATSTANTQTTVAPGMNPPHGQPGHRCDIAVGAPLNSAKTSTAAATTTNSTKPAVPNYSFTPMQDATQSAAPQFEYDSTGAALNPPHGKPGHDCAIPVGKPLTAKK